MPSAIARRRKGWEHEIEIREHRLIADEPRTAAAATRARSRPSCSPPRSPRCTAITIEMYADRKGWDARRGRGRSSTSQRPRRPPAKFEVKIRTPAELTDEQRERILVIARKCPVHKALMAEDIEVDDSLELIEA